MDCDREDKGMEYLLLDQTIFVGIYTCLSKRWHHITLVNA